MSCIFAVLRTLNFPRHLSRRHVQGIPFYSRGLSFATFWQESPLFSSLSVLIGFNHWHHLSLPLFSAPLFSFFSHLLLNPFSIRSTIRTLSSLESVFHLFHYQISLRFILGQEGEMQSAHFDSVSFPKISEKV